MYLCINGDIMEDKKINPLLTGSAETMLQSFYARAKYSRKKNAKFYDAKAIELVDKIDYDFSKAEKDSTMSNGVIARTIVFDELVKDFINKNPDCTVVNIACGLDTRFYRMDNGRIIWYNVDLPETIEVRDAIYHESGRVSTIGISATDPDWADKVTKRGKMLFIIEGLSMYLTSDENAQMLSIIRDKFDNATVLMECLAKKWVNKEHTEKSIQDTGAKFVFGADTFDDLGKAADGFRCIKNDNIIRGMTEIMPILKPFRKLPFLKKFAQKILIFEKA
ncbi:o-methyltransferase domain protein [[Eubacterium] siraeum CAG:80]|uniref:O-methyltransferase domain protein n=1 Tax=[Eubacterium] siraeum CAG:80 TaxID=1263080 RepID=R6SA38_9FIRM|nr:o-methyltransferase domain protein [[Eubacterium] siraeum CAG:80]